MGGIPNISGIHVNEIPNTMIHVRGSVDLENWYQVTILEVRSNHVIAEVDHQVEGRSGTPLDSRSDTEGPTAGRKVWWVDTSGAECFHSSKSCDMLKSREGDLCWTETDLRNDPLPDEISDMRRCQHCH